MRWPSIVAYNGVGKLRRGVVERLLGAAASRADFLEFFEVGQKQ